MTIAGIDFSWTELYWWGALTMFLIGVFCSAVYFMSGGHTRYRNNIITKHGLVATSADRIWMKSDYYIFWLGEFLPTVGVIVIGFLSIFGIPLYMVLLLAWIVARVLRKENDVVNAMMEKGNS